MRAQSHRPFSGVLRFHGALFLITLAGLLGVASAGANPSQIQYGYDPIIEAGGSGSGWDSGGSGSPSPDPDQRVEEASDVVVEIEQTEVVPVGSSPSREKGERAGNPSGLDGDRGQELKADLLIEAGGDQYGRTSDEQGGALSGGSVWLVIPLLLLTVGLVAWAVAKRREAGGPAVGEVVVRSVSALAFGAILVILGGSNGPLG